MKPKITNLNPALKTLSDGIEPPSELPEIEYIDVTHEEYERLFGQWDKIFEVKDE